MYLQVNGNADYWHSNGSVVSMYVTSEAHQIIPMYIIRYILALCRFSYYLLVTSCLELLLKQISWFLYCYAKLNCIFLGSNNRQPCWVNDIILAICKKIIVYVIFALCIRYSHIIKTSFFVSTIWFKIHSY